MADFKCSGNCLNCSPAQRAYCASQHAFSNMKVLDAMMGIVVEMKGTIEDMRSKVDAMQNTEVFEPNMSRTPMSQTSIVQSGDGTESRSPETI